MLLRFTVFLSKYSEQSTVTITVKIPEDNINFVDNMNFTETPT